MSDARRMIVTWEPAAGAPPQNSIARDMALGGLFIETLEPIAVGTLLTVEMTAGTKKVSLDARVFYVRDRAKGPNEPAGMAVRFLDLPVGTLGDLTAIVEHYRPPARTVLGIGNEEDALWASAGGRDETGSKEEVAIPSYIAELEVPARESLAVLPKAEKPPPPTAPAPGPALVAEVMAAPATLPPVGAKTNEEPAARSRAQVITLVALMILAFVAALLARSAISSM